MNKKNIFILLLLVIIGCKENINEPKILYDRKFSFEQNKKIGRGINIGNALEAPNEGDWGVIIKDEYFEIIKNLGFNSVRIPVKWSAHLNSQNKIDEAFFNRVEYVVDKALSNNLIVILNVHHFDEIHQQPDNYKNTLYEIWDQIAKRFLNKSTNLMYEILNEPTYNLTTEKWNEIYPECINIIRKYDKRKTILLGGANWNSVWGLEKLSIPDDENIILTFHYYEPFQFTHQGAEWVNGSDAWLGTKWLASDAEISSLKADILKAINFAKQYNLPLNCGEFGSYYKADSLSRVKWTKNVVNILKEYDVSFNYWEFCAGFGIYNPNSKVYQHGLIDALLK